MTLPDFVYNTLNFDIGSYSLSFPYVQAIAIVVLLFLLILSMAQFRHHYVDWSFKGAVFGIFFGVLITLILEGFFLVYGKTALTSVLGWKDAPKPISLILDAGRAKLTNVLGVKTESSIEEKKDIIKIIQSLDPAESKKIKNIICAP